jgi:hypothetical protein
MRRCRLLEKTWVLLPAMACTPLGLWMYQDPGVTVSRVRLGSEPTDSAPVVVALDVRNPNDYGVSTTRVELWLRLDDRPIGRLDRASHVALPQVATSTVALPLVPDRRTSAAQLRAFGSGVHRFMVEGRATFATPIGSRKVRFAQEGQLAFGPPALPASAPAGPAASP